MNNNRDTFGLKRYMLFIFWMACLGSGWSQDTVYLDGFYPDYDDFYTFGYCISSHNNQVVVTSPGDDGFTGAAYLYDVNNNGGLTLNGRLIAEDTIYTEYFGGWHEGDAVHMHNNNLIIGADYNDDLKGAAYVFERSSNNSWNQVAKLQPEVLLPSDNFGSSVAINDSFAVVTAPLRSSIFSNGPGAVFVFKKNAASLDWEEDTILYKAVNAPGFFGEWVQLLNDNELMVSGMAYNVFIYKLDTISGEWEMSQNIDLTAFQASTSPSGYRIDASEDYWVAAVPGGDKVFIFKRENNQWVLDQTLYTDQDQIDGLFGYSVSITNNYLLVGAPMLNSENGGAFLYEKDSSGWVLSKVLLSSTIDNDKRFGEEVCVDGELIVIGAPEEEQGEGRTYFLNMNTTTNVPVVYNHYKSSINVYPNPAHSVINFDKVIEYGEVRVFNEVGELVLSTQIIGSNEVNIQSLPKGVFVVELKTASNVFQSSFVRF